MPFSRFKLQKRLSKCSKTFHKYCECISISYITMTTYGYIFISSTATYSTEVKRFTAKMFHSNLDVWMEKQTSTGVLCSQWSIWRQNSVWL